MELLMAKGINVTEDKNDPPKDDTLDSLSLAGDERVCVGAPLIDHNLFYEIESMPVDAFTVDVWRSLFRLQKHLHNKGFQVDKNTIINCADKIPEVAAMLNEAGGMDLLDRAASLMDLTNYNKYVTSVVDAYDKRMIVIAKRKELKEIERLATLEETSAGDIIKLSDSNNSDIAARVNKIDDFIPVRIDPVAFLAKSAKARAEGKTFNGIPTNMRHWDEMMGGLARGRFYVAGGPTGVAKSFLVMNMMISAAFGINPGDPTSKHLLIETGELIYEDDFLPRLLSNMSGVYEYKISRNLWDENVLDRNLVLGAIDKLNSADNIKWVQMDDFDGPRVYQLIKRMKHKINMDCVWFDGIKINPNWKPAEQYGKIGDLSQWLKKAAVDFKISVFATIQLTTDASQVGRKKGGFENLNVDMFAGGRRVLQNADVGLTIDYWNAEDPFDEKRKIIIGKSRFCRWHRKGEWFEVEGKLHLASLVITNNHLLKPLDKNGDGLAGLIERQGDLVTTNAAIEGRTITVKKPEIDYSLIPDFD
jgi:replicative DNA helicase